MSLLELPEVLAAVCQRCKHMLLRAQDLRLVRSSSSGEQPLHVLEVHPVSLTPLADCGGNPPETSGKRATRPSGLSNGHRPPSVVPGSGSGSGASGTSSAVDGRARFASDRYRRLGLPSTGPQLSQNTRPECGAQLRWFSATQVRLDGGRESRAFVLSDGVDRSIVEACDYPLSQGGLRMVA